MLGQTFFRNRASACIEWRVRSVVACRVEAARMTQSVLPVVFAPRFRTYCTMTRERCCTVYPRVACVETFLAIAAELSVLAFSEFLCLRSNFCLRACLRSDVTDSKQTFVVVFAP